MKGISMTKEKNTRRDFLKTSVALAAAGVAMPTLIPRTVLAQGRQVGANDRIIVGFVGVGGRGKENLKYMPRNRTKVVAISDVWHRRMVEAVKEAKDDGRIASDDEWKLYSNDQEMYDKEKLDCCFDASPDHVRSLVTIRAMMAGLDVYAEKCLTTYIAEGREMVKCARKHNRVFQVGTQGRSMPINEYGSSLILERKLGAIRLVQACNHEGGRWISEFDPNALQPPGEIPDDLDWDAWQGPVELPGFNARYLGWMSVREFSNWQMTVWGTHSHDQIQWALGADDTGPVELWPLEDQENVQPWRRKIGWKYANGVEVRGDRDEFLSGGIFRCTRGNLEIARGNLRANPESLLADIPASARRGEYHYDNFFDCMVSRKKPNADVEIGHRSATVCHLVGITRDLNRRLKWDPDKELFIDDDEANKLVDRPRRKGYEIPAY